jgi:hypothetical protein
MVEKDEVSKNFELTPSGGKPWYKKKRFILPIVFFIIVVGASSGDETENSSSPSASSSTDETEPASTATEEPVEVPEPSGEEFGNYPESQAKFVKIIEEAKTLIDEAETDLQESVALRARDKQLCTVLQGNKAVNWTGTIKNVGANGEGKAYVDIEIADRVRVQTWNNAFSDFSDNTLVPTTSKFFNELVSMNKGDLVKFSATFLKGNNSCLKKGNLTDVFYGISPEFIVKFSSVIKE